jgi:hypothetical protein
MAKTTTIRVDALTHAQLLELAAAAGISLMDTVRLAAGALRRQRFAEQVALELDQLRADETAFRDYLAEAESTSVGDGID